VRGARAARREPDVGARDLDGERRVADGDGDLVERTARREHRERRREGDEALERQTRRDAEEVLLGDADLDEAVREGVLEHDRPGRGVEVGVEHDDVRTLATELDERRPEGVAHLAAAALTPRHRTSPS
jgi:hypothetical protein